MNKFKKVLVIGSGPIVIGQSSEYDYAGLQACKVFKEENIEVVLINPNPNTITTDKNIADKVYLEPLNIDVVKRIIELENIDCILPTVGGDKGFEIGLELSYNGYLEEKGIALLGVNPEIINTIRNRQLFKEFLAKINEPCVNSKVVCNINEAMIFADEIGYPVFVRPAYTLGGDVNEVCLDSDELSENVKKVLNISKIGQVLVEKCISGWKEIEFEVMRDIAGNCISVCSMENLDPVGIHTGDSIIVMPAQTLNNSELELLRSASLHIANELGIEGSCNVQIALKPDSSTYAIIELSPKFGRNSALVSKATGYPIAQVATKIALGYKLYEIKNNITGCTTACNEPAVDYCAVKIPKWSFNNFEFNTSKLGASMQATGEAICIGTSFELAFMKAVRSINIGVDTPILKKYDNLTDEELIKTIDESKDDRIFTIYSAIKRGISFEEINKITHIDYWFLSKIKNIANMEKQICCNLTKDTYLKAKSIGFLDETIEKLSGKQLELNAKSNFNSIDTCAAEFDFKIPYFYSAWDDFNEAKMYNDAVELNKKKVLVVGSGPSAIGQGIDLDYCAVNCIKSLKSYQYETITVNNNPEAVSTDYETADKLYLEPINTEDILNVAATEKPDAAVVQFSGITAKEISASLNKFGIKILGADENLIEKTQNKIKFNSLLEELEIPYRPYKYTKTLEDTVKVSLDIGFPVSLKADSSRIIAYNSSEVIDFFESLDLKDDEKILIEKYFIGVGVDIYSISDGKDCLIPCIYEHIERAGVNAGDSISVTPPITLNEKMQERIIEFASKLSKALGVKGIINIEFVCLYNEIYLIHAETGVAKGIPFITKATGLNVIDLATKCMLGESLSNLGFASGLYNKDNSLYAVRVPVFSFEKLAGVDTQLGIDTKSTGEAIGIADNFEDALLKGLIASGMRIKKKGGLLVTVRDADKQNCLPIVDKFSQLGFNIYATAGTAKILNENCIATNAVRKLHEEGNNVLNLIESNKIDYVISTSTRGLIPSHDDVKIRRIAVERHIPTFTSIDTANALVRCLMKKRSLEDIEVIDCNNI